MSEFRQDLVSGDWIIVAPERGRRPHAFRKKFTKRHAPRRTCPFEDLKVTGNWPPLVQHPGKGDWRIVLIPNKFPALTHVPLCAEEKKHGPYPVRVGIGHHHLVVTKDHDNDFARLSLRDATRILEVFQMYHAMVRKDRCLKYVSAFANWGPEAGASLHHPHYQLLALPIVPPDVEHSLEGSSAYFKKHKKCVHCAMIAHERKEKKRVISESARAIALAPFVSRFEYETRIFPVAHIPCFEDADRKTLEEVALLLQKVLQRIKLRLGDPDYNFFIHTSPLKRQKQFGHYHWHIEVLPKITTGAGFELGTGVEINTVLPEDVAKILM